MKIAFGFTYNLNQGAARQGGQLGKFVIDSSGTVAQNDLQVFFADVIFKYNGISFMAEYANKWGSEQFNSDQVSSLYLTGTGYMASLGYVFTNNWEIAGRYTKVDPDNVEYSSIKDRTEYTLGLSKYVVGHNLKIQSDISYLDFESNDSNDLLYRLQIELQL